MIKRIKKEEIIFAVTLSALPVFMVVVLRNHCTRMCKRRRLCMCKLRQGFLIL